MANRRSLGDALALTPDKVAFIQGATAKAATVVAEPVVEIPVKAEPVAAFEVQEVEEGREEPRVHRSTSRTQSRRSSGRRTDNRPTESDMQMLGMANLLVPLTTRLQPSTAAALKRAGLEQKLRGQNPATVQEIVEIAVSEWLEQNSFL